MRCFLKNIGFLFIVGGAVLLGFYTTQNRIENWHYVLAGAIEIVGLSIYIITNRFLKEPKDHC